MGECNCSRFATMQLFHELKQQFPTLPDHVVSQCIIQNNHDRESCERSLQESQKSRPPPGAFPPPPPQPEDYENRPARKDNCQLHRLTSIDRIIVTEPCRAKSWRARRPVSLDIDVVAQDIRMMDPSRERKTLQHQHHRQMPRPVLAGITMTNYSIAAACDDDDDNDDHRHQRQQIFYRAARGGEGGEGGVKVVRPSTDQRRDSVGGSFKSDGSDSTATDSSLPPLDASLAAVAAHNDDAAFFRSNNEARGKKTPPQPRVNKIPLGPLVIDVDCNSADDDEEEICAKVQGMGEGPPALQIADAREAGSRNETRRRPREESDNFQSFLQVKLGRGAARKRAPPVPRRPTGLPVAFSTSRVQNLSAPTTPSDPMIKTTPTTVSLPATPIVVSSSRLGAIPKISQSSMMVPRTPTFVEENLRASLEQLSQENETGRSHPSICTGDNNCPIPLNEISDEALELELAQEVFACLDQLGDEVSKEERDYVKKQIIQREKASIIVAAVKEACKEIKDQATESAREFTIPEKSAEDYVKDLKSDIYRLQLECDRLAEEVQQHDPSVPLGETNEEFYKNIYTGQEYDPVSESAARIPPALPIQPPAWEDTSSDIEDDDGPSWVCWKCTFKNHPLMNKCEECETSRIFQSDQGPTGSGLNQRFTSIYPPRSP